MRTFRAHFQGDLFRLSSDHLDGQWLGLTCMFSSPCSAAVKKEFGAVATKSATQFGSRLSLSLTLFAPLRDGGSDPCAF